MQRRYQKLYSSAWGQDAGWEDAMEGTFSLRRRVRKGGKRDRTARFINVLGISVQECTMRFKIDGVIHTF